MHSKQTVKYLCRNYPSGNCYYFKTELITHDRWDNIDSLAWSSLRPITEKTYRKREKEGYKCEIQYINKYPAEIIQLFIEK